MGPGETRGVKGQISFSPKVRRDVGTKLLSKMQPNRRKWAGNANGRFLFWTSPYGSERETALSSAHKHAHTLSLSCRRCGSGLRVPKLSLSRLYREREHSSLSYTQTCTHTLSLFSLLSLSLPPSGRVCTGQCDDAKATGRYKFSGGSPQHAARRNRLGQHS